MLVLYLFAIKRPENSQTHDQASLRLNNFFIKTELRIQQRQKQIRHSL